MNRREVINATREMRMLLSRIEKEADNENGNRIENLAIDLESKVGALVAEMQINGLTPMVKSWRGK